jgi:hypothetical protein
MNVTVHIDGTSPDMLHACQIGPTSTADDLTSLIASFTRGCRIVLLSPYTNSAMAGDTVIATLGVEFLKAQAYLEDPVIPDDRQMQREIVDHNRTLAQEIAPQALVLCPLCSVDARIHGFDVRMIVDTGAQRSLLPYALAQEWGIDRLIDTDIRLDIRGVGEIHAVGIIWLLSVDIGCYHSNAPFWVIDIDRAILGMDWLSCNSAQVDLRSWVLQIQDSEIVPLNREE